MTSQVDGQDGSSQTVLRGVFLILLASVVFVLARKRNRRPLPPGPPGLPLIGNALDIPKEYSWLTFRDFATKYGDVVTLRAFGSTLIILSSVEAAIELMEKRSSMYADRPPSVLSEMIGWTRNFAFRRYDDQWRTMRRLFWQHFQPSAVQNYRPIQQREARRFLRKLLEDDSDLDGSIKISVCQTLLNAVYGIPAKDITQRYVELLEESNANVSEAYVPGAFFVEFIPWLRHIPSWVPGTGWQKKVKEWKVQANSIFEEPYMAAQNAMKRGVATPSMLHELLEAAQSDGKGTELTEEFIKGTTATAFLAGTDTTVATFFAFFCAMIRNPEMQKRAQKELDSVVGPDRLPEHSDRPSLPYIDAILKETLRWYNVAPLGMAHRCMQDDEYRGWTIPKGATVMINLWAIFHDPHQYPDPHTFRPERFLKDGKLNPDVPDPTTITFGFGRRICPGRHFADDALFINMASVLHVFDILPALDEFGKPIPVEAKFTSGFLSMVEPFKYSIRPRSKEALSLILETGLANA
ncbi:cytochrome P450 [Trametes punicea]|nr:cytochrome P450 [Trametes punicea]